jgi:hypothetical protein
LGWLTKKRKQQRLETHAAAAQRWPNRCVGSVPPDDAAHLISLEEHPAKRESTSKKTSRLEAGLVFF